MQFAAGGWLAALALIPALWLAFKASDRRADRRARTLLGAQFERAREGFDPRRRGWQRYGFLAGLLWLVLALARPQWGASEVTVTQRGHDVVIALDISRSMLAQDVAPSRLERAKSELTSFLRRQAKGRVGLVLFAGAAFVQCPLTADLATAEIFLQMADPDMISTQGTSLAGALQVGRELLASGRMPGEAGGFQAILLVTDGEDLEGGWEDEARACRREGITVIPVGLGEESGGLIPVTDAQGRPAGFLRDEEGNLVLSRLDLASLERLAAVGGGSTFRIGLDGLAGERLRAVLERLGQREFEQRQITRWQERFRWPLALALLHLGLAVGIRPRRPADAGPPVAGRRHGGPRAAVALACAFWLAGWLPAAVAEPLVRPGWATIMERGRAAYAAGDYEAALREFERARVEAPAEPRLALAVGAALFRLGRHEEAVREFSRARSLSDRAAEQAESLYNAGTAALALGDAQTAVQELRRSLQLEPDRPDALHNLEAALRVLQEQEQEQQPDQQPGDRGDEPPPERQDEPADGDPGEPPRDADQPEPGGDGTDQADAPQDGQADGAAEVPELDREQALRILQALDRDEQDLRRAVQQRLRGPGAQSGREW